MSKVNVVTTLPDVEAFRRKNMLHYSAMMGVRLVCLLVCFIVPLTWVWVPALIAVFIPMVATLSTTQQRTPSHVVEMGSFGKEISS